MSEIDLKKEEKNDDKEGTTESDESDDKKDDSEEKPDDNKKEPEKIESDTKDDSKKNDQKKLPLKERIKKFFENPKKRLIFIISLGLALILIFGLGLYLMTRNDSSKVTPEVTIEKTPEEVKYPAVLNGVMTDQASASRHPLGIIVENHTDARPQSGLEQADVIYEAVAEGGITRFLTLFGTNETEKVGPVRSARTYYVDWAHGYNAYLAHVGGNYDALEKIQAEKILDLDQFRYSGPYWRETGLGVSSEHTMFTSTTKLRAQAEKNGYATANTFTVYKYKEDPTIDLRPEAQAVTIKFSGTSSAQYDVTFDYDKTTNLYKRTMGGKPHTDRITKNQLSPKNIVVMTVDRKATVTKINEQGYTMTTVGTGKARFYIDGKETLGTWKKDTKESREMFYDATGAEIIFDRGQLWICVTASDGNVTAI